MDEATETVGHEIVARNEYFDARYVDGLVWGARLSLEAVSAPLPFSMWSVPSTSSISQLSPSTHWVPTVPALQPGMRHWHVRDHIGPIKNTLVSQPRQLRFMVDILTMFPTTQPSIFFDLEGDLLGEKHSKTYLMSILHTLTSYNFLLNLYELRHDAFATRSSKGSR